MSVVKEKMLEILGSDEIRMPRELGKIVIEYSVVSIEDILAQEDELYTLLEDLWDKNPQKHHIDGDPREHYEGRMRYFINVCLEIQADDNSNSLSSKARNALADFVRGNIYLWMPRNQSLLVSLKDLISYYIDNLPSHKQKILFFLESIIIFTDTHVAIEYTQDELNFLSKQLTSERVEITPEGTQKESTVTEVNQYTFAKYSDFDAVYFNAEQRILYINKENTKVVEKFQELSKGKREYDKTKDRLNSSALPAIDELLQLDERLRKCDGDQWPLKNKRPDITAIYPKILRAIKEEMPVLIDIDPSIIAGKILRPFNDPTQALALLITGIPIRYQIILSPTSTLKLIEPRGLLKHFQDVKFLLESEAYSFAEKLMAGMLLYANTHVCITVNAHFYENIKMKLKIGLNKLEQDSQLKQQDQFKTQLNECLRSCLSSQPTQAVGLVTVQKEGIKLYVDVSAKEAIALLKACVSEMPLALSNEYQDAVMKVISSLKSPGSSSTIFYSSERSLLQPLLKKFQQQAGTVVDPKSGSQCLKDFQVQIQQFMQENRNILKISKNASTTRKLIAMYEAAGEQIKLFEQPSLSRKRKM